MNKRIAIAVMGLVAWVAGAAGAAGYVTTNLANETGLAYNNTYAINVATFPSVQQGMSRIAAQVVYSSMSPTIASYNGGQLSTASITVVNNNGLKGVKATDNITVPSTANLLASGATAQITLSSAVPAAIVTINGNQLREGIEWVGVGLSSHSACVNLSVAINTYLASTFVSTCPLTSGVIYATSTITGSATNNYTITSSTPPGISTGTLSRPFNGGRDRALAGQWIEFNGDRVYNGYQWNDGSNLSSMTAVSIANWLNSYGVIKATAAGSVVYATATVEGVAANAYTLKASTTNLVIASANFTTGQDTATLTINGIVLTAGTQGVGQFTVGASSGATAENISSAIVNTPSLAAIVTSTNTGAGSLRAGIVFTTSTAVGTAANYSLTSSTPAALSVTNNAYFGGKDSSITKGSAIINIASHGLTTGLAVYQSTGSGVQFAPLVWGTTYYVIRVDANNLALATSNANAVAGSSITITSSSTLTTAPTATLTPSAVAGTVSWKWQFSNDGTNWLDYTTPATYTIGSYVFPSTSTAVDFGDVDYQQIRLNVTAPTAGGLGLKVILNGRLQ